MTNQLTPPLAERLRPQKLEDYIGQTHLTGSDGVVRRMIESGQISSFILWGPPGVGKTTLARIIANTVKAPFHTLSAVHSGVKEVREVLELWRREGPRMFASAHSILLVEQQHRSYKSHHE